MLKIGVLMDEKKDVFNMFLEDGRRAEKVVQSNIDPSSSEEKIVTEIWEEPKIEKKLSKRVVDYKKPLVYKREIEFTDETGEVIERKIESLEPESKLQLREHLKAQSTESVSAQSVEPYVTREELQGVVSEGLMMLARTLKENNLKDPGVEKVSSYQAILDEKYNPAVASKEEKPLDTKNYGLWAILGTISSIFIYVTFIM
jgi:hypothetical protein